MILMGDEVRRTLRGNNNAYCQDNELSWFDWSLSEKHADIFRFAQHLTRLRSRLYRQFNGHRVSIFDAFEQGQIEWHGVSLNVPDWGENSHSIAVTLTERRRRRLIHFMINAYWEPLRFELPYIPPRQKWHRLIDTSLPSPFDIAAPKDALSVGGPAYCVQQRSIVVLCSARSRNITPPCRTGGLTERAQARAS
jgi:isoamylase